MNRSLSIFLLLILGTHLAQAQVYSNLGSNRSLQITPRGMTGTLSGPLTPSNVYFGGKISGSGGTGIQNTVLGVDDGGAANGSNNAIIGSSMYRYNLAGHENTLIGASVFSLIEFNNVDVRGNVIVGSSAFLGSPYGVPSSLSRASYTTVVGASAMHYVRESNFNTAIGAQSLNNNSSVSALIENSVAYGARALASMVSGNDNVAYGYKAMEMATGSDSCTAIGYTALEKNVANGRMTAIGRSAMGNTENNSNQLSGFNVAIGYTALYNTLSTGTGNVAAGFNALYSNQSGSNNTAVGNQSLSYNTTGASNVSVGTKAAYDNTTGTNNVAIGYQALYTNKANIRSTAVGYEAMRYADSQTTGVQTLNTAVGYKAMRGSLTPANNTGRNNVAIGDSVLVNVTSGSQNTVVGTFAGNNITTGSNNTVIGYGAEVPSGTASNQVKIGNSSISYAGVQVAWTITSDRRWKEHIKPLLSSLAFIKALRPVVYHRTNNPLPDREFGFIAQELQEVMPQLGIKNWGMVHTDDKGFLTVRYNDLMAPLIKAMQEQQTQLNEGKNQYYSLTNVNSLDFSPLNTQADALLERLEMLKK
jgi:hypothetical protein